MKRIVSYLFLLVFVPGVSCRNAEPDKNNVSGIPTRENEDEKQSGVSLFIDSLGIAEFFTHYGLGENYLENARIFYRKRNNAFAWIDNSGVNEYGRNFMNLLNSEERLSGGGCVLFKERLFYLYNKATAGAYDIRTDASVAELELLLTVNFFDYASRNWHGISDEELKKVGWFIERKNMKYEELLDTVLKNDPRNMSAYEPVMRQYGLLRNFLRKYREIEEGGGRRQWSLHSASLRKGDTSALLPDIRNQLYLLGDLAVNDSSTLFDGGLEAAVKRFEKRHGLSEKGIIAGETLRALQVPLHERIQQLLINIERSRWVPAGRQGDYLVVNIPAFKLLVYHNDNLQWSCNVIVGKSEAANNTVIFNDDLKYIVFSPYWNIPENILTRETLPEIKKDLHYLSTHDMEVVDDKGHIIDPANIDWELYTSHFPYTIRQCPGKNNALGLVKFLFPNSYDIYMHDTPEKSLFNETTRTFSHGCIRVEEPYKLAAYLLRDDTAMTAGKMNELLYGGKETFVRLKNKVPVFIAYFTAWVDMEGRLNFRDDVYHHDAKMKQLMFSDKN